MVLFDRTKDRAQNLKILINELISIVDRSVIRGSIRGLGCSKQVMPLKRHTTGIVFHLNVNNLVHELFMIFMDTIVFQIKKKCS